MTDNEIIKECRKKGLQNGSTIGLHSGFMDIVADRFEELLIENEKLKEENKILDLNRRMAWKEKEVVYEIFKTIKSESVKEFAERLKGKTFTHKNFGKLVFVEDIDNLVKEMVGEKQ